MLKLPGPVCNPSERGGRIDKVAMGKTFQNWLWLVLQPNHSVLRTDYGLVLACANTAQMSACATKTLLE
jgi:hypothetical protein